MQGMSGWAPYNETEHLVPVAQPIPILAGEHPQKGVSIDVCPTLPAAMGMGGGHTPLVPHPVAYSFDSLASNSMKSSNPHSGCREVETSKTIDTTIPESSKNQGGIAIAQPIAFQSVDYGGNATTNLSPTLRRHDPMAVAQPIASLGESSKSWWDGGQTAATLTKQNAGGNQRMPDKDNFGAVIEQVAQPIPINTMTVMGRPSDELNPRMGIGIGNPNDPCPTLTKAHSHAVAQPIQICFNDANGKRKDRPNGGCYITENPKASPTVTCAESDLKVLQPIAVDTYNYTTNKKTTQTIRSQSDTEHIGAVLEPTIIDRAAFNQGQNTQYEPRIEEGQTMPSLVARGPHAVADPKVFDWQSGGDARGLDLKDTAQLQRCQTPALLHTMAIRRLTPKECERLQGFPDDWTKIPYRGKSIDQCPDGPRYKACGNSMAVNVMHWIGKRISYIEELTK